VFSHFTYLVLLHNLAKQEIRKTVHWNIVRTTQSNFCSALDFVYPEPWAQTARRWTHWLQDLGSHTAAWVWVVSRMTEEIKQQLVEFRKCTNTAFEWKMQLSCFPALPGSTETQAIWGDIIKWLLIAYFIGNICAKNIKVRSHVLEL